MQRALGSQVCAKSPVVLMNFMFNFEHFEFHSLLAITLNRSDLNMLYLVYIRARWQGTLARHVGKARWQGTLLRRIATKLSMSLLYIFRLNFLQKNYMFFL